MFRRRRRKEPEFEPLELSDAPVEEASDVYMRTAIVLARCPNPFGGLAVVISHLLAAGVIDREQLTTLGMTAEGMDALNHAFDLNSNVDDLVDELAVSAARRAYEADLGLICAELGLVGETRERQQFKSTLAGFALSNGIDDIRIAYRLMRLERPDLLPDGGAES